MPNKDTRTTNTWQSYPREERPVVSLALRRSCFTLFTHFMQVAPRKWPPPLSGRIKCSFFPFLGSTETLVVNGILFVLLLDGLMVSLWGERSKLNSTDSHLSDKTRRLFVINDPDRERLHGGLFLHDGIKHEDTPGTMESPPAWSACVQDYLPEIEGGKWG